MSNQQVIQLNAHIFLNQTWTEPRAYLNSFFFPFLTERWKTKFGNLRDYTRETIRYFKGWLRYSPVFCKLMKWNINFIKVNKIFISTRPGQGCPASGKDPKGTTLHRLSTSGSKKNLDPYWVTGFVDAEGCFSVIIEIQNSLKWKVRISFEINLHEKDTEILYKIKSFFGVGAVYHRRDKKTSLYRVSNVNYIKDVIIPHFTHYPLMSKKAGDFLLWSKVIQLILSKHHLTREGFLNILSYYASINRGISNKVLQYYPNLKPADIPVIKLPNNLNPEWVSGFVAGDGGFSIYVRPAKDYAWLEKVYCRFHIAQHIKDKKLLKLFIKFFDCGVVAVRSNLSTPRCDFIIQNTSSILHKVLPHFDTYPVLNLKQEDYICFKQCMTIIKDKQHLTPKGLKTIKDLNLEMNSNRYK